MCVRGLSKGNKNSSGKKKGSTSGAQSSKTKTIDLSKYNKSRTGYRGR